MLQLIKKSPICAKTQAIFTSFELFQKLHHEFTTALDYCLMLHSRFHSSLPGGAVRMRVAGGGGVRILVPSGTQVAGGRGRVQVHVRRPDASRVRCTCTTCNNNIHCIRIQLLSC